MTTFINNLFFVILFCRIISLLIATKIYFDIYSDQLYLKSSFICMYEVRNIFFKYKNKVKLIDIQKKYQLNTSVQFSHSVMSDSLQPHESQDTRPPCPSPTPRVHSDSCPSSQWCHPAISSSVVPFSSCPQSLPASESLPMSQLFSWGGQSTGVSALASFLPKKYQG